MKKALKERKSLDYKGPRIFSSSEAKTGNKQPKQASHVGRYKFGGANVASDKSVIRQRTRVKGETKVVAFLQA